MKNKIATLILGILLIGIVSAGLVNYLSNTITGEVEVKGPIFYATSENKLLINEFDNSTANYSIQDSNDEKFWSEKFSESLDFYKPKLTMSVKAKVADGTLPKNLELVFGYYSNDNLMKICDEEVSVNSGEYEVYSVSCEGIEELKDVDGFYYKIIGMGTQEVECMISVSNGETKVDMDKA
jgi:hypothetical protein